MKTFFIDVGTHNAQEYSALFEANKFSLMWTFVRHRVRAWRKRTQYVSWSDFKDFLKSSEFLKLHRKDFFCIFIEPNRRLCATSIYKHADAVFNVALSADSEAASFLPLYFAHSDKLGQGSSLFKSKPNVDTSNFEYVVNIDAMHFASQLTRLCDSLSNSKFQVILRINNEGAEVEVIEAFHQVFQQKLVGVMGSLADVAKVKSPEKLNSLMNFMIEKKIPFTPLHSNMLSWPLAGRFLVSKIL